MESEKVLLIGSSGSIGSILLQLFEKRGLKVTEVKRVANLSTLTIDNLVCEHKVGDFDLIVDASTAELSDYLRLVNWIGDASVPVVHFSSVRANSEGKLDRYSIYKKSVLRILTKKLKNLFVINGDLFSFQNSLVGYWSFVTNYSDWKFLSARDVRVCNLEMLADSIINSFMYKQKKFNCNQQDVKTTRISSYIVKFLFRLRFNRLMGCVIRRCLII